MSVQYSHLERCLHFKSKVLSFKDLDFCSPVKNSFVVCEDSLNVEEEDANSTGKIRSKTSKLRRSPTSKVKLFFKLNFLLILLQRNSCQLIQAAI